ncbi:unnamed protein product [Microthlaspi erraticum]|uniref:Uncharacterized protein n=1 Tax=Microthlaspi erraticum TaxID=1685480 RepID=A0A6D2JN14_9BRAS|nr:unnamed protein product [Microthlaspi erraticum]
MRMYHRGEIPPMDGDRSQGKSFPPRPPKSGQQEKRGRQPRPRRMQKRRKPRGKRNRDDHDDLPPPPKRQVSMIMGGLLDNDDSISAIKEYERKAVAAQRYPDTGSAWEWNRIHQTYIPSPHRFTAEYTYSCGTVRLPVYVGGISKLLKFIVMDKPAIYNAILGTPWLHEMKPSSRLSTSA